MTTGLLEKPAFGQTINEFQNEEIIKQQEENKEELCKKLCMNILEGLLEGYENLKEKNSQETKAFESKINELKSEIHKQKVLV